MCFTLLQLLLLALNKVKWQPVKRQVKSDSDGLASSSECEQVSQCGCTLLQLKDEGRLE